MVVIRPRGPIHGCSPIAKHKTLVVALQLGPWYNETVTTLAGEPEANPRPDSVRIFFDSLAAQDFPRLASAFSDDVHLRALLPGEFKEWHGAERVAATFRRWLDKTEEFELVDATVDVVGTRLHLRWRARLRAERIGEGWFVVEQEAYVDTDADDRIRHLSLLCSGYLAERAASR
jgi:hypothetical protein